MTLERERRYINIDIYIDIYIYKLIERVSDCASACELHGRTIKIMIHDTHTKLSGGVYDMYTR